MLHLYTKSASRFAMLPALSERFDRVGRSHAFRAKTKAQWRSWRRATIARLKELTGYDTLAPAPLRPRITERVACDGYERQRVEIQTERGVTMPIYVLVPEGLKRRERRPAVLCAHGHQSGGKLATAGVLDDPLVRDTVGRHNYDYGLAYVRRGLIALCPDARGFGERREPSINIRGTGTIIDSSCQNLDHMAHPLGLTVTGMWVFDLHRLLDYAQTRRDVQPDRIGCVGLSGGGLQALWATALDTQDRIKAAVVSGYFYGYKQSLLELHHNCSCNFVPHMYETADMGDLGALIAPRPLLIETGNKDDLNGRGGVANVKSQVAITRRAYALLGAKKNLVHDVFPGPHRWHGQLAEPWLVEQLSGSALL